MKKTLIALILCSFVFGSGVVNAQEVSRESLLTQLESLKKILYDLQERVRGMSAISDSQTDSTFTNIITLGAQNTSVALLQQVLATSPNIYPQGLVTGYFGPLTKAALENFQREFGLEVTGTFTNQTRHVLSMALTQFPISQSYGDYLQLPEVRNIITSANVEFSVQLVIRDGRVSFSENPTFEVTTIRNADIATLQRILATDPAIYPEQTLTGVFDSATALAVSRLQIRYGLTATAKVDIMTLDLLKEILLVNNSTVIRGTLLQEASVQPGILTDNKTRDILVIDVVSDYRVPTISVKVTYDGGISDSFSLAVATSSYVGTSTRQVIVDALVDRLGRSEGEISTYLVLKANEKPSFPGRVVIQVMSSDKLGLRVEFLDKTIEDYTVPVNFDQAAELLFRNDIVTVAEITKLIISDARRGLPVHKDFVEVVMGVIAEDIGVPVADLPEIEVEYEVQ